MMIETGGETNGIYYSCMYDPYANPTFRDAKTNLDGYEGIVWTDDIFEAEYYTPAILWFDRDRNFVFGQSLKM